MAQNDFSLEDIVVALHDLQVGRWTAAAGQALFIYDILLLSAKEYRYVWKVNWSYGKVLYILARYPFTMILTGMGVYLSVASNASITPSLCKGYSYSQLFAGWLQLVTIQAILGLRAIAMYNLKLEVISVVGSLALISWGSVFSIAVTIARRTKYFTYNFGGGLVGCAADCVNCLTMLRMVYLPIMAFDAAVFFLTLYKHNLDSNRPSRAKPPLLRVLYRDGFLYFAVNFTSVFINFVIFNTARPTIMSVMDPLLRNIMCIAVARLLLNLRCTLLQTSTGESTAYSSRPHRSQSQLDRGSSPTLGEWNVGSTWMSYDAGDNTAYPAYNRRNFVEVEDASDIDDPSSFLEMQPRNVTS